MCDKGHVPERQCFVLGLRWQLERGLGLGQYPDFMNFARRAAYEIHQQGLPDQTSGKLEQVVLSANACPGGQSLGPAIQLNNRRVGDDHGGTLGGRWERSDIDLRTDRGAEAQQGGSPKREQKPPSSGQMG